jgi:hypothetical protein
MTPGEPPLSALAPLSEIHLRHARALSEDAKRFYEHWGFVESPHNPMTLVARLKDLK